MNSAAGRLIARVLTVQFFTGLATFFVFVTGAPPLLLLDPREAQGAQATTSIVAAATEAVVLFITYRRLARVRYVLRALALGSRAFEPDELAELARVPDLVTAISVGVAGGLSLLTLIPTFRADEIDLGTALELFCLSVLVISAFALPLYVVVRNQVSRAMELAPPDVARDVLDVLEESDAPRGRVLRQMVAAVVVPISFVAAGAALVAHAHVRAKTAETRAETAVALGRAIAVALPGASPLGGRRDALAVADLAGYPGRLSRAAVRYAVRHAPDGTVDVSVPVDDTGVQFQLAPPPGSIVSPGVLGASAVVLVLALFLGRALGRALADDLVVATRHVRSLGNDDLVRGGVRAAGPARFRVVNELGRAIEDLTARFRVFAAAQERAIAAREQSLRLRGLLFASVSHDLKSPLNAILGFCALAAAEPLSIPQLESVDIIERRGRELLALIETILDAARVEAQRLTLARGVTSLASILDAAVLRGDELGPMHAAGVEVTAEEGLPPVDWDGPRMAQAIGALVGHAKRLSPRGGVRVSARREGTRAIALDVRDPSTVFSVAELGRLLDARAAQAAPGRHGGLALGLSLARALISLHGGRLSVEPTDEGGAIFHAVVPIRPP